jgi:hypothetical protein
VEVKDKSGNDLLKSQDPGTPMKEGVGEDGDNFLACIALREFDSGLFLVMSVKNRRGGGWCA